MQDDIVNNVFRVLGLTARLTLQAAGLGIGFARQQLAAGGRYKVTAPTTHRLITDPAALQAVVIKVPRHTTWQVHQAEKFVEKVLSFGTVLFQLLATEQGIAFRVVPLEDGKVLALQQAIHAALPESEVSLSPYLTRTTDQPIHRLAVFWQQANIFPAPIRTAHMVKDFDPLIALTQAVSQLEAGERVAFSVMVGDETLKATQAGRKLITQSDIHPLAYTDVLGMFVAETRRLSGVDKVPKYKPDHHRVMDEKLNHRLYHVAIVTEVEATREARVGELMESVVKHVGQFENYPFNTLLPALDDTLQDVFATGDEANFMDTANLWLEALTDNDANLWSRYLMVLDTEELAALWHLPYQGFGEQVIDWVRSSQIQMPKSLRAVTTGVKLGVNRFGSSEYPVYQPATERTSHMLATGKTGVGKSNMLHQMIHQDIANGNGVCVIDPHGNLVKDVLQTSIPKQRELDVVVLDIGNREYPPPFNPFTRPQGVDGELAIGKIITILSNVYQGDFPQSQMAGLLENALYLLAHEANPTLMDIQRVFDEPEYRAQLLTKTKNIAVRQAWKRFDEKGSKAQDEMTFPLFRRLDGFYKNNALLAMTCHPKPLDIRQLVHENKILLVSLGGSQADIPELERQIIGAAVVSQIQLVAMKGAVSRSPYMVYIDEAQHFVKTPLATMLSEIRKSGLGLVLANQYFDQVAGQTFKAIEGNIGTIIAFEMGKSDATLLAPYMGETYRADDLVTLGKYRAAVSMRQDDVRHPGFSLETLPPLAKNKAGQTREATLRRLSVEKYTPTPYSEVETWLMKRYDADHSNPSADGTTTHHDTFIE